MKKIVLLSILSGLLWTACTKQETMMSSQSESSFLTVKIVSAGTVGTRAADEEYKDKNGDLYKDGTDKENEVVSVLFLFFDDSGDPAVATKSGENYLTYAFVQGSDIQNTGKEDHSQTIEKILETTIHIDVPAGTAKPTQLFTVVNPKDHTAYLGKTMNQLRSTYDDFETRLMNEDEKKGDEFVMSTSVFMNKDKKIVDTTPIKETDYYSPTANTDAHPVVTIYVERILARIDFKINIKNTNPIEITSTDGKYYIYPTGKNIPESLIGQDSEQIEKDRDIYVRFLGWNVFNTPDKSRLVKKVDSSWEPEKLFGYAGEMAWNSVYYHRSYWAVNLPNDQFGYKTGPFRENVDSDEDFRTWTAQNNKIPDPDEYVTAYFQENAAPSESVFDAPSKPSSVIVAAQLVDKEGNAREMAKWGGNTFTVDGLKNYFANVLNLWSRTTSQTSTGATETTYSQIQPKDLAFQSNANSYKVSLVLTDEANNKRWYSKNDDAAGTGAIDDKFREVDPQALIKEKAGEKDIMIWTNGYTYFHFEIRHLGEKETDPGYYGIVRNHIYETTITSVYGIGTPVYNPEDDITDTTEPNPEDDKSVLSAEVRILSWRVVRQDYDLTW